jgi:pseudaminic acid cytidylyltransferase
MRVAIIPARGGSKRIPRKNSRNFCGKPMICWSIEMAQQSGCFDRVIVSTDDEEIASVAKECGAEAPFVRPQALSGDYTGTGAVMKHAIDWLAADGNKLELACCLYPTAPFVTSKDLHAGLTLIRKLDVDFVFSVTSYAFPVQRALKLNKNARVEMFDSENFMSRSQDLTEAWHDAGQFYWGTVQAWADQNVVFSNKSTVVKLPRYRVQDIDTPEDWAEAEFLFSYLKEKSPDDFCIQG